MNYVAQIENGLVVRVVVAPASTQHHEGWIVVGAENTVGVGWRYEAGEFVAPFDEESLPITGWDGNTAHRSDLA